MSWEGQMEVVCGDNEERAKNDRRNGVEGALGYNNLLVIYPTQSPFYEGKDSE
jgi:hypothetical protein